MKILIYVNTKQSFHNTNNLGGIEILNFDLYNYLNKHYETLLTNSLTIKIKKTKWDIVISSNDSIVFDLVNAKRKILWLHNKLQIEKAFRKKQLFSILFNNIEAVFVSNYLNYKTTKLNDFFSNKEVIFYNNIDDLASKIKYYSKNDALRKKIAKSGQDKYFKLFNGNKIAKHIVDISLGNKSNLF